MRDLMRPARRTRQRRWLVTALAVCLLAGCATGDHTEVVLTIRPGSSFREAADSLAAHGVVRFPRLFGFYAARRGRDRLQGPARLGAQRGGRAQALGRRPAQAPDGDRVPHCAFLAGRLP